MPPLPAKPGEVDHERGEDKREQPWRKFFPDPEPESGSATLDDRVVVGAPVSVDGTCPRCGNEFCTCYQGTFLSS